jgi:DNA-binding transcriptional LysR family regulator
MPTQRLEDHLNKLRAFCTIAELGTLREAAERLNVTQPSLTRLVQTLEAAAGAPLFIRARSGVAPTVAGQELLAYARRCLNDLADVEAKLRRPAEKLAGHVRIGSYESLAEYLWPRFVVHFRRKYPGIRLTVQTTGSALHPRALANGAIDLLVDAEPRLLGEFHSRALYEDTFQFYSAEPRRAVLTPAEAAPMNLIYCPQAFDRQNRSILHHCEAAGFTFAERTELDSFPTVKAFARAGAGIAVLPRRLAAEAVNTGALHAWRLQGFAAGGFGAHGLTATVSDRRQDDPVLRVLLNELKAWFKNEA